MNHKKLIVSLSVVGVLAVAGGGIYLAQAALTFSGTTVSGDGSVVIDSAGSLSIGTSTATGITIGRSGVTTTFLGNLSSSLIGNVAVKPVSGDSQFFVSTSGADSNDGLSWGSAKLTISAALAALPAAGGHITVGCGTFSYGTALSITKGGTILSGSGWGQSNLNNGCTILSPTAGVTGIDVNGASHVILEDFRIFSASSGAGSDYGIHIHGTSQAPTIRDVTVEFSGSHGIFLDSSSSGNVDFWFMQDVRVLGARGDCFEFAGGTDTNVGTGINLDASGCTGWGFKLTGGSGARTNMFISTHASGNVAGGYDIDVGAGNRFMNPYTESGTGSTFVLGAGATENEIWFPFFGQATTITNTGGGTNILHYYDSANAPIQNGVSIAPDPGATTPTTYEFLSGNWNNGWFSLKDTTNGNTILYCVPGTGVCSFVAGPLSAPSFIATGNIGIGTTTAATTLQVAGSSTIRLGVSRTAYTGCMEMYDSVNTSTLEYVYTASGVLSATTTKPSFCQ